MALVCLLRVWLGGENDSTIGQKDVPKLALLGFVDAEQHRAVMSGSAEAREALIGYAESNDEPRLPVCGEREHCQHAFPSLREETREVETPPRALEDHAGFLVIGAYAHSGLPLRVK